ncbi:hypothetical protein BH24BAC1_BH24BAC1_26400 [soil metagenome]
MENKDFLEEGKKYGFIQDNQVWLKPFMDYPARQVGEVKETADDSLLYFAKRFQMFREKVDILISKIETSDNKGSFLMKVLHLKDQVGKYDALGDFEAIYSRLSAAEEDIKETIGINRDKNLATKAGLIKEAEALQASVDWKGTTEKLKELRQTWIKTGPIDKALTEEVEERFKNAVEAFFTRKKEFFEDKQNMLNRAIEKYRLLISQSNALKNSDDFEGTTKKLKQLQQEWKEVGGNLPRKLSNDLWTSFRAAHNHFFERLKEKINQQKNESKDKYLEDNLAKKKQLVQEAEELLHIHLGEAGKRAKELQAAWKKVGPVKQEESDAVWEGFIVACDKVFELSSLEYYVRKKIQNGERTSPTDQVNLRINALRDFIKADKQELDVLESNLGKLNPNPGNETFRNMLQSKIRNLNRKINTKNDLIELVKKKHGVESR